MAAIGCLQRGGDRGGHRRVPGLPCTTFCWECMDSPDRGRSLTVDRHDFHPHAADGYSTERHRDEPRSRTPSRLAVDRRRDAVALPGRRPRREGDAGHDRGPARADSARMAEGRRRIDLAGRDVLEALQTSVTPRVIETPVFQGVAQNGIQLNVKARITVRTNLDRYIGGATEETIIARVGEGIITSIGAADDHMEVMEFPDRISKRVLGEAWMRRRRSRSCRSTSPTSTWARTSAPSCRPSQAEADTPHRAGKSGGTTVRRTRRRTGTGKAGNAGDAGQGGCGGGADPAGDCRSLPER